MPNWWDEDAPADEGGGEGNWWEEDADQPAPPKKKDAFSALRGAQIKAQPPLLSRIGSQAKGFLQELPLIASRGVGMAQDLAQGKAPWDPAIASERASREAKINEWLGAAKPGEEEKRTGRVLARMVPGAAAAYLTGGMSLPAQGIIQGGVQGLQSLSEGASPEAAATGAFIAGLAPGAGKTINAGVSKLKAPFAKSVDQGVLAAAQRQGVELPASAVTNSSLSRGLEQMASRMVGGAPIEQRGIDALDDIAAKAGRQGAGANPMLAGERTAADYGAERASLQGVKNAEYGKVGDLTKIPAGGDQTIAELDRLIQQGTLDPDTLANLRKLRAAISPKAPDLAPEVQQALDRYASDPKMREVILKQFGIEDAAPQPRSVADLMSQQAGIEYGGPNAMRDAGLGNRLRQNLGADVDSALGQAAPDQLAQLQKAKEAYGRYADLSKSELGTVSSKFAESGQFDQIPNALLRPNASASDIKRLLEVVTPETKDQLREVLLRKIVGSTESITPKQIERGLSTYGRVAKELLTPEQIQQLRDLSTVRKAMGKTTIGSPTTPLLQARKYIETPARALMAGSVGGVAGVGAELGAEALIARLLGSKGGQRWLTTGLDPAVIPGRLARGASVPISRLPSELEMDRRRRELDALIAGQ